MQELCRNFGLDPAAQERKFASIDADYKFPEKIRGDKWIELATAKVELDTASDTASRSLSTCSVAAVVAGALNFVGRCKKVLKDAETSKEVKKAAHSFENIRQTLLQTGIDDVQEGLP